MTYKTVIILTVMALVLTVGSVNAQEEFKDVRVDLRANYSPRPPSAARIDLSVVPLVLNINDPQAFATITALVLDNQDNPVAANLLVNFTSTMGSLSLLSVATDANGEAHNTLMPGIASGIARVSATTRSGDDQIFSNVVEVELVEGVSVEDHIIKVPVDYCIESVYPNPFNDYTTIMFGLPKAGKVLVTVYDLMGKRIATLTNSNYQAGWHTTTWTPHLLANGEYIVRMESDEFVKARRLVFLK